MEEEVGQTRVLNEMLAASDSFVVSDDLKKKSQSDGSDGLHKTSSANGVAVTFRLDQRRATMGGAFDAAAAGGGLPQPPTTSPGGANEAPSPKKSKPTTPSNFSSANHETQKKRNKWRKSSSWSPKALQEELKKCELREGAEGDDATSSKKPSGSKKSRAKSKGSTSSPLRKGSVNAVGLMSLDHTVAERRANLFGSSSDSSWNRVGESHHREGQGASAETPAVATAADEPLASSIVQELRKMKELKKQEEEEAIKEAESGKNKKKKKTMAVTMRRKDKGRRKQEAVLPVLVDRALNYLERNSADVDQPSLSEDMSGIQKKVLKCLKDALDSDLKHASKLHSALGTGSATATAPAGGTDPSGAVSPRWGSGVAGSRVATMQASTLSALKKDETGEWIVDFNAYDLTTVIAFIKYYLTEQPLIPEEIYEGLSAAIEIQFQSFRQNEIHSLLSRLPHTNLRILKRMLVFLSSISKNVAHKLTIGRVATCFATVLLQPAHLAVDDIKVQRKDISLLRELIMNYAALFTTNQQLQFIERDGNLLVRYATLSKIVEKLVDESYSETEFADIIFLTHSYFTSAPELLRALANMHVPLVHMQQHSHKDNNRMPTMATKNWQHRIRLRVLRLIRDWVDGYPEEILSNSEFMEKLQEFIQDKPAGLLGRNSQIEEEESMFLALSGWMQEAKSKQKALKEAAELRAKETASAAASTDNNSVAVGECEVLKLADTGKVHDEEVSDIEDDDLSGSDVELKFSDEDDDEESDGSDGEKSAVLQEPRAQKTGFALNLSQAQTTSEPGVSLRRTPPMLAQMKRGPQMMSSSDFFDILAKGTQIMMKDQRVSAPSGLQRNQHAVVRKEKSATTALEAKPEENKVKETGDSTNVKSAEEEKEKEEERKVSVLAELKAEKAKKLTEKSEDEAKSEATSESEASSVPKKSEKAKKKKKRESRSNGDSSVTDEPKEKKKKKKKRSAKSSITKHSSLQTKPQSLKSSLSENNVAHIVLKPKKDSAAADQLPTSPPQPTVDSPTSRKAHSQEKKVKKSKKASKKKYQTFKKLSSKKSTETEQLIAGVHTASLPAVKDSNIADARLAEVLFDVEFPSTISADELLGTTTKKEQVGHADSKQASPRVAVEPAAPANAPPLSPKTSGESTTVSAEMDAIDRDELLERIKDRTDLESQLLRHLINKERQMEREIDNLRKTVEKLVSAKVERFGLSGISSSIKDDSSGNVPTRKADPITAVAGGSGSSKKASLIKSFKNDADTIVAAVPKDALLGGGLAFKVFAMDHVALAKELTLRDSELFRAINSRELIHKRFMKPELSPTFQKMVLSFNEVGDWVLSEVLRYDTPADRGNAITTFIRICDQLWSLKNFNMLFAVLGGLNKTPVRRLKASWKKVPSKEMKIFKKQMTLTDTEKNNSVYRHALRRAKPPLVPYLALFSKDLFSLEEGVPTTLSAEEDATISLINFDKLRLLYQLLKEFRQLQQSPYTTLDGVRGASSLQVLLEMTPPLEEKDSYTISYKWEPRQPQA